MENIVYHELLFRGFDVDVGVVEYNYKDKDGNSKRNRLEIDFIANKGSTRYYIQSALNIDTDEKVILYLGIRQFLSDSNAIDL